MTLLRTQLGSSLRGHRLRQRRTLRDVSHRARVSLGYLSEVERGQKEASSELLASICDALDLELADLLAEVSRELRDVDSATVRRMPTGARPASVETAGTTDTAAEAQPAAAPAAESTAAEPAPAAPAASASLSLVGAPEARPLRAVSLAA
jgi:transcriptional regulator with XRE-family HTH domain